MKMEKINLEGLDEVIYYEKLENGLDVYVLKKENFHSYSAYFITKYGALTNEFVPINEKEMHKFPEGIAHFLEHKMFEQESGPSVMEKFSSLGGYCNAFTNYINTAYYVSGTENFYENLDFLIDYVQSPYFTDENVEKEKGIIVQELLMTKDNPYRVFSHRKLDNLFVNLNFGNLILGEKEDIESITKEDLYRCYNTFYNPENMSLIIVTNENEEKVLEKIKENQNRKKFDKLGNINIKNVIEPKNVKKSYDVFFENVSKPQLSYSIKICSDDFDVDISKLEVYLYILLVINFGKITGFGLDLKEKNMINGNISLSASIYENYIIMSIGLSSDVPEEVIKLIEKKLSDLKLNKEFFEIVKKSMISNFVYYFTSVSSIMDYLYNDYYYYGKIRSDKFKKYKELNFEELESIFEKIDFENKSITIMKPLSMKE